MPLLKTAPFVWGDETFTLHELSALDRLEHAEFVADIVTPEEPPEGAGDKQKSDFVRAVNAAMARQAADLLSRSLRNGVTAEAILRDWPIDALGAANRTAAELSGMIRPDQEGDATEASPKP